MYSEYRDSAERTLRKLLVGATFVGVKWYGTLIAVIARDPGLGGRQDDISYGEIYLSIESRFVWFADQLSMLPDHTDNIPDAPFHEQVGTIARLARDPIIDVRLGAVHPHLILTFVSGSILFLNGLDDKYEPWNVQTWGVEGGEWTIVAVPGSDIAVFDPANTIDLADDL